MAKTDVLLFFIMWRSAWSSEPSITDTTSETGPSLACPFKHKVIKMNYTVSKEGKLLTFYGGVWQFLATECITEGGPCTGVDTTKFNSSCHTEMSLQPAVVKTSDSEEFKTEYIPVPAHCVCRLSSHRTKKFRYRG